MGTPLLEVAFPDAIMTGLGRGNKLPDDTVTSHFLLIFKFFSEDGKC